MFILSLYLSPFRVKKKLAYRKAVIRRKGQVNGRIFVVCIFNPTVWKAMMMMYVCVW